MEEILTRFDRSFLQSCTTTFSDIQLGFGYFQRTGRIFFKYMEVNMDLSMTSPALYFVKKFRMSSTYLQLKMPSCSTAFEHHIREVFGLQHTIQKWKDLTPVYMAGRSHLMEYITLFGWPFLKCLMYIRNL